MATDNLHPINLLEYECRAAAVMRKDLFDFFAGGACDEQTLRENVNVFQRFVLRPRVMVDVSQVDTKVELLSRSLNSPLMVAPVAYQALAHPEAEIGSAKAAAACGVGYVLSMNSTSRLEDIAQLSPNRHSGHLWFQLYVLRDRALTQEILDRAFAAGYSAICVTVDRPTWGGRERDLKNGFVIPASLKSGNFSAGFAGRGNSAVEVDPSFSWKDLEWLQTHSKLPVILKGVLHPDDAKLAVDHGVPALIVSNHGARNLDGIMPTLEALADVVDAVQGRAEILMDGGIRRGTDVIKALALGARAVLVGRPIIWGLAVAGERGVTDVLKLLDAELKVALALVGCPSVRRLDRSYLKP